MKKYVISIIILLIIIVLSVGGYFIYSNIMNNKSNDVATLNEKCLSEIDLLETSIVSMMNGLNNITYTNYRIVNEEVGVSNSEQGQASQENSESNQSDESGSNNSQENSSSNQNTINSSRVVKNDILSRDNNTVDWNGLKSEIENMYDSWTIVLIDLTTLNVNKDNLLKFNSVLDQIVSDLDNEDKSATLTHMADLYNLLTLYVSDFANDSSKSNIYNVKSNILYAYSNVETENWDNVKKYISNAKANFSSILNNQVSNMNNINEINKAYILINELENDCDNKNKKVFYVNYRNFMQELENI